MRNARTFNRVNGVDSNPALYQSIVEFTVTLHNINLHQLITDESSAEWVSDAVVM